MYVAKSKETKKQVSLKEVRTRLGLSQSELAEHLGSNQTAVSALESGRKIPDWLTKAITLHRLLDQAGYTLDDLILSLPDPEDTHQVKP